MPKRLQVRPNTFLFWLCVLLFLKLSMFLNWNHTTACRLYIVLLIYLLDHDRSYYEFPFTDHCTHFSHLEYNLSCQCICDKSQISSKNVIQFRSKGENYLQNIARMITLAPITRLFTLCHLLKIVPLHTLQNGFVSITCCVQIHVKLTEILNLIIRCK